MERELGQTPLTPPFVASSIAFYTIKQSFEEKSSQGNNKNKINTTKVWY
jgi:hypothetical protein